MAERIVLPKNSRVQDLAGQRFGKLTVIEFAGLGGGRAAYWWCNCDCGKRIRVRASSLKNGHTQSCNCLQRIAAAKIAPKYLTKHGQAGEGRHTAEFMVWNTMKCRCRDPKNPAYHRYGGRGINVCDRWANSFVAFFEDMGPRPSKHHTIERNNNNGNYEPSNCRWATRKEQARNTRRNRLIEFNGTNRPLAEWAELYGIEQDTVGMRIARGWSIERALTTPVKHSSRSTK